MPTHLHISSSPWWVLSSGLSPPEKRGGEETGGTAQRWPFRKQCRGVLVNGGAAHWWGGVRVQKKLIETRPAGKGWYGTKKQESGLTGETKVKKKDNGRGSLNCGRQSGPS